jgi:hypothetical protein
MEGQTYDWRCYSYCPPKMPCDLHWFASPCICISGSVTTPPGETPEGAAAHARGARAARATPAE